MVAGTSNSWRLLARAQWAAQKSPTPLQCGPKVSRQRLVLECAGLLRSLQRPHCCAAMPDSVRGAQAAATCVAADACEPHAHALAAAVAGRHSQRPAPPHQQSPKVLTDRLPVSVCPAGVPHALRFMPGLLDAVKSAVAREAAQLFDKLDFVAKKVRGGGDLREGAMQAGACCAEQVRTPYTAISNGCRQRVTLTIVVCLLACAVVCLLCCRRCSLACAFWRLPGRLQQRWRQLVAPSSACSCSARAMQQMPRPLLPQRLQRGSS
jgi:hypothetical protein